ncbi:AB hydrolase-1 domain-containing protein [Psidium guajava]|nr:AB hydrolase-1 domain-containing protein [Psidium guajava]
MSIEALAMAGVDHAKSGIEWRDFGMETEPPPPHLVEEHDTTNSVIDARDHPRRRNSGNDEDRRMKLEMLGWAKRVASTYEIALELKRKEGRLR